MRIVSIGAHPDDVEIGSGGTLAKHVARGDEVHIILCTFGGVSGDPQQRKQEAQEAAGILGVRNDNVHFLDYPISKLNRPSPQFAKDIKQVLDKIAPERLYVHGPHDFHQVHVAISESTMAAVAAKNKGGSSSSNKGIGQVLFYETISSTTTDFKPNAFVDITGYIDLKIKSIEAHRSQSNRFYLQPNVIRSLANTRYVWGKVGSNPEGLAEGFRAARFVF